MNFKARCVVCTDKSVFTAGRVYEITDGTFRDDKDFNIYAWSRQGNGQGIDALNYWYGRPGNCFTAKFELVKESKMFTKDDIKANDFIFFTNGNCGRAIEFNGGLVIAYESPKNCHDEFQFISMEKIEKICRPIASYHLRVGITDDDYGEVVFDREKGIGCEPPVKEISVDEAAKLLTEKFGQNVRIRVGE